MAKLLYRMLVLLMFGSVATAADWPQWLGPHRDGVWRETGILDILPKDGPKVLWKKPSMVDTPDLQLSESAST